MAIAEIIIAAVVALIVLLTVVRSVRIVPQARARNVERFGRYRKTLEPGMNFVIPFVDRLKPLIDLREQVVSFTGQPVITEDNLVVQIDTVLFFQVTDPRAADYEIVNYIQAIEQITATMLRSVIGSMDLEQTLTSRDKINTLLRGVLDDASGKWGIRVTRVEIKAIDPPKSVKDAMEKQMRAEREKRAAILTAEGTRQSAILTADGEKQSTILRAEGDRQASILRAEGQAQAIGHVFQSIHRNDPDPKLLAYQYLQTLPQLAQGAGNTFWVIPSEVTTALKAVTSAFGGKQDEEPAAGGSQAAGAAAGTALPVSPAALSAATGPAAVDSGAGAAAAGAVAEAGAIATEKGASAVGSEAAGSVGPEAAPDTGPAGENAAAALAAAGIAVSGQLNAGNGATAPQVPGEASPGSGEDREQGSDQQ
jgi:regulator of protease activity HflC (stomatin/prohibitin superfamily)